MVDVTNVWSDLSFAVRKFDKVFNIIEDLSNDVNNYVDKIDDATDGLTSIREYVEELADAAHGLENLKDLLDSLVDFKNGTITQAFADALIQQFLSSTYFNTLLTAIISNGISLISESHLVSIYTKWLEMMRDNYITIGLSVLSPTDLGLIIT